jgi:hypothetical protein
MLRKLLSRIKQALYHRLKLYPIYRVIDAINKRFPLKGCRALEAFAFTGAWQARAYRQFPSYHEAWEIKEECRSELMRNLPRATIKITDSFEEVRRCDKKFDFINVDTHQGLFGPYCENFEFFPLLFRVAADEVVVNLNVIPSASPRWRKKYGDLFSPEHLARRRAFYGVDEPEHVSLEQMLRAYGAIAAKNGYHITWHYYRQRTLTWYLALHMVKNK